MTGRVEGVLALSTFYASDSYREISGPTGLTFTDLTMRMGVCVEGLLSCKVTTPPLEVVVAGVSETASSQQIEEAFAKHFGKVLGVRRTGPNEVCISFEEADKAYEVYDLVTSAQKPTWTRVKAPKSDLPPKSDLKQTATSRSLRGSRSGGEQTKDAAEKPLLTAEPAAGHEKGVLDLPWLCPNVRFGTCCCCFELKCGVLLFAFLGVFFGFLMLLHAATRITEWKTAEEHLPQMASPWEDLAPLAVAGPRPGKRTTEWRMAAEVLRLYVAGPRPGKRVPIMNTLVLGILLTVVHALGVGAVWRKDAKLMNVYSYGIIALVAYERYTLLYFYGLSVAAIRCHMVWLLWTAYLVAVTQSLANRFRDEQAELEATHIV